MTDNNEANLSRFPTPEEARRTLGDLANTREAIEPHMRGTALPITTDSIALALFVVGMGLFLDGSLMGVGLLAVAALAVTVLPAVRRRSAGITLDLLRHPASRTLALMQTILVVCIAAVTVWLFVATGTIAILIGGTAVAVLLNVLFSVACVRRIRASLRGAR